MKDLGATNIGTGVLSNTVAGLQDQMNMWLQHHGSASYDPNTTTLINSNSPMYIDVNNTNNGFAQVNQPFFPVQTLVPDRVPLPNVYPFDKPTVSKRDGIYYVELSEEDSYFNHVSIPSPTIHRRGVLPEELLLITQDYLECFEELSEHQQQALKHIKYAAAFLTKHILETHKTK
jgi:hypothetical protein